MCFLKAVTTVAWMTSSPFTFVSLQAKDDMEANIEALKLESKALRDMQLSSGTWADFSKQTAHDVTVGTRQCRVSVVCA